MNSEQVVNERKISGLGEKLYGKSKSKEEEDFAE
jgi:hypothetical protein